MTERFRGHSISDPGLYRTKEQLSACMEEDPIRMFAKTLIENGMLAEEGYEALDKEQKD